MDAAPAQVVVLGVGGLGRCALPLLVRHLPFPAAEFRVLDAAPSPEAAKVCAELGVQLLTATVTEDGYRSLLAEHVAPGGLLIDLAYNLDTVALLTWCAERDVTYLNTSVELWDPYAGGQSVADRTLYARHMRLREQVAGWRDRTAPTAVVDHGANPGLVSHFVKAGLLDLAGHFLADPAQAAGARREAVADALAAARAGGPYGPLAQHLGVKVIHISERDLQVTDVPKRPDEFVNTWSVEGLYEEAIAPAELGWGTHERTLPPGAVTHASGPRHQIALPTSGYRTLVRSWVPSGEIHGMLVRHGEAFSITEHLTVRDADGRDVYRPTVHYAYCLTDSAVASLYELGMRREVLQPRQRVLHDEVVDGADEFGVLLAGHDYGAWWYGCLLDIHTARALHPGTNATLLPVAAGVMAAAVWAQRNPRRGVHLPDMLPHDEVLEAAWPYLGPMHSGPVDWCPRRGTDAGDPVDAESDWQFAQFLV